MAAVMVLAVAVTGALNMAGAQAPISFPVISGNIGDRAIEIDDYDAERQLRPCALWRKRSLGSQSQAGRRFVERIMTVVSTLRQQHRNVLDYLSGACDAAN